MKSIKFIVDQVRGGWNIDIVRQKGKNFAAHRIARFGAEVCTRPQDEKLAEDIAHTLVDLLNHAKYTK